MAHSVLGAALLVATTLLAEVQERRGTTEGRLLEELPPFPDAPLIESIPAPSRVALEGRCLAGDRYRLTLEYETEGSPRYQALLVYAEPSHRLLLVQWNGKPADESMRRIAKERSLVTFEQDAARRYVTIPFTPVEDDGLLVEILTLYDERIKAISGKVADMCKLSVANWVSD